MTTTSIHRMNADEFLRHKTPRLQRKLWTGSYYLMNQLNNALPMVHVDPNLQLKPFKLDNIRKEVESLDMPKASPSRLLSNLFWKHLNWQAFESELGHVNISDFGCGGGQYGELFHEFAKGHLNQYHGYDYFENDSWKTLEQTNPYMRFHTFDASKQTVIDSIDHETTLLTSQSAIEHFDEDLTFFEHIRDFVQARQKPTLQIHLFPSAVCLDLYRLHGVRQYTPRTVSKITRLFSEFSTCVLYDIGNKPSNDHHRETITKPVYDEYYDYRETNTEDYYQATLSALEADMQQPFIQAGFYALIIHSYPQATYDYIQQ